MAGKKDEEVQVFQLEYLSKVRFRRVLLHDKVGYGSVLEVDLHEILMSPPCKDVWLLVGLKDEIRSGHKLWRHLLVGSE